MGFFDDTFNSAGDISLTDTWNTATNFGGSDSSWFTPRTTDTVPTNALQSMQPVTTGDGSTGSGWGADWGKFLQNTLGAAIGYSLQKDAVQSGVVRPTYTNAAGQPVAAPTYTTQQGGGLQPLLLIGALVLVGIKLLK